MVEKLAERGVPLAAVRNGAARTRICAVLPGKLTSEEEVSEALAADPKVDVPRWFTDHALVDEAAGQTYVIFKMWGRNTEPTLIVLRDSFPEAKVTFRRAEADDD